MAFDESQYCDCSWNRIQLQYFNIIIQRISFSDSFVPVLDAWNESVFRWFKSIPALAVTSLSAALVFHFWIEENCAQIISLLPPGRMTFNQRVTIDNHMTARGNVQAVLHFIHVTRTAHRTWFMFCDTVLVISLRLRPNFLKRRLGHLSFGHLEELKSATHIRPPQSIHRSFISIFKLQTSSWRLSFCLYHLTKHLVIWFTSYLVTWLYLLH